MICSLVFTDFSNIPNQLNFALAIISLILREIIMIYISRVISICQHFRSKMKKQIKKNSVMTLGDNKGRIAANEKIIQFVDLADGMTLPNNNEEKNCELKSGQTDILSENVVVKEPDPTQSSTKSYKKIQILTNIFHL